METNIAIVITLLLLASAGVTFLYLLKNNPILPQVKIHKTEEEQFMYNFLLGMATIALIGIICATIIMNEYFKYIF